MVPPAQLRNSFWLISCILLANCHSPDRLAVNVTDPGLIIVKGLLMLNDRPFNGSVLTIFPGTTDTAEVANYFNGKEHGEWKEFYPSGKLKETRWFVHGQKSGEYIAWWESGGKQLHYFFKDDEYEGICREWNEQGVLVRQMNYKSGHEEGSQQLWYDNGKIRANYVILNGRRYGLLGTKNCINVSDSVFTD